MPKWRWLALSCLAFVTFVTILSNMRVVTKPLSSSGRFIGSRIVLYTAPHAEVATFQRVWNPDTNSDYSLKDFEKDSEFDDESEADKDTVFSCGEEGSNCPEVPAFGGENYFDSKPIG